MSIVYIPSENCPKCPFNTLCKEEKVCPLMKRSPVNIAEIKKEMALLAKVKPKSRIL